MTEQKVLCTTQGQFEIAPWTATLSKLASILSMALYINRA